VNYLSITIIACALTACAVEQQHEPCATDHGAGIVEGHDGPIPAISSCAVFQRAVIAFELRATELGCEGAFPLEDNPLGDLAGCFAWQADEHAAFIGSSRDCEILHGRTSRLENWAGFECGGAFCYAPPYFEHHQCDGGMCGRGPCGE
jgi:hypothetical protein